MVNLPAWNILDLNMIFWEQFRDIKVEHTYVKEGFFYLCSDTFVSKWS